MNVTSQAMFNKFNQLSSSPWRFSLLFFPLSPLLSSFLFLFLSHIYSFSSSLSVLSNLTSLVHPLSFLSPNSPFPLSCFLIFSSYSSFFSTNHKTSESELALEILFISLCKHGREDITDDTICFKVTASLRLNQDQISSYHFLNTVLESHKLAFGSQFHYLYW